MGWATEDDVYAIKRKATKEATEATKTKIRERLRKIVSKYKRRNMDEADGDDWSYLLEDMCKDLEKI
jgi:hypothetical protein